jgi:hypothetical protein
LRRIKWGRGIDADNGGDSHDERRAVDAEAELLKLDDSFALPFVMRRVAETSVPVTVRLLAPGRNGGGLFLVKTSCNEHLLSFRPDTPMGALMSLTDRRRYPRFPFHSRAALHIDVNVYRGVLLDISMCGALFAAELNLNGLAGRRCRINVFRGKAGDFLIVDGAIVQHREALIAVQFGQLSSNEIKNLRQIVELNLGVAKLLERDVAALLR